MATAEDSTAILTVNDLAELFGPIPTWRIRDMPAPGTAKESDGPPTLMLD